MKTIATAALFLTLTTAAWADESKSRQSADPVSTDKPFVPSETESDRVTAGSDAMTVGVELDSARESAEVTISALLEQREKDLATESALLKQQAEELAQREAALKVKQEALANQQHRAKEAMLAEIEQQNRQLSEERAELGARAYEVAAREAALEDTRQALEKDILEAKDALAVEIGAHVQALAKEKAQLRDEFDRLATAQAALQDRRALLAQEERQQREELAASLAQHKQKVAEERALLERQAEALAAREETIARSERELKEKQAKVEQDIAAELQERSQQIAQRERQLQELENRFNERDGEFKTLSKQLTDLDAKIEKRRLQIATLEQVNGSVSTDLTTDRPQIKVIEPVLRETRGSLVVYARSDSNSRTIVGQVIAPRGLYQLFVNDERVSVDSNLLFQTKVTLLGQETPVQIVALDKAGQRSELDFLLLAKANDQIDAKLATENPKPQQAANLDFGRFHALIIGNEDYLSLPDLRTAHNDAIEVAALLERKYGFKTTVLLDATRTDILAALNRFRADLTEKDNFLLYYAGHGTLDSKNQRGHWLPVDAKEDDTTNWISNVAISDQLNLMSARKIIVIADSCYSGTLTRSTLTRLDSGRSYEAYQTWLKLMVGKKSRVALTSGDLKPVLDGGGGRHSIFSKAFLDALKENIDIIEGSELHKIISQSVTYAAAAALVEQVPQYSPINYAGHESGDFFFVPEG